MISINRIKQFISVLKDSLKPSDASWRASAITALSFWILFLIAHTVPILFTDFTFEKLLGFLVLLFTLLLAGLFGVLLLRFVNSLPARFTLSLLAPAPMILLSFDAFGAGGAAVLFGGGLLSILLIVGSVSTILNSGFMPRSQKASLLALFLGISGLMGSVYSTLIRYEDPNPLLRDYQLADRTLELADPSEPGQFEIRYTTYGSGSDRHRKEYADEVGFKSESVDASKLIDNWDLLVGWARSRYWGFGPDALPVQGRVWSPQGEGPFPLVLIVHGNHSMEDYSDSGYDYLGELLASQGYIVVSVDQNFLNFSFADFANPGEPGIKEENDARGWLLLEHLNQWRNWNSQEGHEFYGRVDFDEVSLIGHSRGGEAVAIASHFNGLGHYPDDATLAFDYHFDIKSIISIAPVDGQYTPRDRGTPVKGTSYFSIHGSMDGDASSFMGLSQFNRVELTEPDQIATTLYVFGANHGQFNTVWGDADTLIDWGLNKDPIMDADDQRQIALVYVSAFLGIVHKGQNGYLPLFRDAAHGAAWLPNTYYINNIREQNTDWLLTFEEDGDPGTPARPGKVSAKNLSRWFETWPSLKWEPLESHMVSVAWDEEFSGEASYSVTLEEPIEFSEGDSLIFAVSQSTGSTMPKGYKSADQDEEEENSEDESKDDLKNKGVLLSWSIVLRDTEGNESSVALNQLRSLYPQVKQDTLKAQFAYDSPQSEVVPQYFGFPYSAFGNSEAFTGQLKQVTFQFDDSPRGAIFLDDLGIKRSSTLPTQ